MVIPDSRETLPDSAAAGQSFPFRPFSDFDAELCPVIDIVCHNGAPHPFFNNGFRHVQADAGPAFLGGYIGIEQPAHNFRRNPSGVVPDGDDVLFTFPVDTDDYPG